MLPSCKVIQGHVLDRLREMPDATIQCCVTSPPYWGLRNYDVPPAIFGGRRDCAHEWQHTRYYIEKTAAVSAADSFSEAGEENAARLKAGRWREDDTCIRCGAWRGQLGLERTPALFLAHLVEIFAQVRRVLRPDGTLWLNLGDCYAGSGRGGNPTRASSTLQGGKESQEASMVKRGVLNSSTPGNAWTPATDGFRNKELIGIPWMAAFSLRADGWFLRSECIWSKPNPMPESVTDRPTKSHEQLFLLTKSPRYFYDAAAIEEPQEDAERTRRLRKQARGLKTNYELRRDEPHGQRAPGKSGCARSVEARQALAVKGTRNKRTVWTVPTHPYKDAHFATFPPDLIKPCIQAGTKPGDVVLDPFGGSGTTGKVALELGRNAMLIELNADYLPLIADRTNVTPAFF